MEINCFGHVTLLKNEEINLLKKFRSTNQHEIRLIKGIVLVLMWSGASGNIFIRVKSIGIYMCVKRTGRIIKTIWL